MKPFHLQQAEPIVREHVTNHHIVREAAKAHAQVDSGIISRGVVKRGQEFRDAFMDQRLQARDGALGEIRLVGVAPGFGGFGVEDVEESVGGFCVICAAKSQVSSQLAFALVYFIPTRWMPNPPSIKEMTFYGDGEKRTIVSMPIVPGSDLENSIPYVSRGPLQQTS